jgi:hypothetical protein
MIIHVNGTRMRGEAAAAFDDPSNPSAARMVPDLRPGGSFARRNEGA